MTRKEILNRRDDIYEELEKLDTTVDRQWEDYYERSKVSPVDRIATIITKKESLRDELKKLKDDLKAIESVVEEVQE